MKKIKIKTKLTPFKKNGRVAYSVSVMHNGTVREDTFYKEVSKGCGLAAPMVRSAFDLCVDQMKYELRNGCRVELPSVAAFLTMPGNFASTSPEDRRAAGAGLVAHIIAKGDFRNCCAGEEFELVNVTKGATVVIRGVSDMVSKLEDVLTNGTDVEVHVVGTGLYIPDAEDETTGVWLERPDGTICATARVTSATSATLVCVFDEISMPEGQYKLAVASRNGLDPEQYDVTIARRNVAVVNAAESEDV